MGSNHEVVEAFWTDFEAGDLDAAVEQFAADGVFQQPGMPEMRGREALRLMLTGWRSAFPDIHHEVDGVVEDGDTVAVRLRVMGTHQGTLQLPDGQALPATGRKVVWHSVDWITVSEGRVASWHVYQDSVPLMVALGLMPESAPAG
jgi:predicted ester cyclase